MDNTEGLGQAMANHYAREAGDNAMKENAELRRQLQALTRRVAYLEQLANVDPNIARAQ